MYDGYALALKKQAPVSFKFRGVETTLYPDQLEVDDQMIDIRIKDVMKELRKSSQVYIIKFKIYFCKLPCVSCHLFFEKMYSFLFFPKFIFKSDSWKYL